MRILLVEDDDSLAEAIAEADEETLYMRFFTPVVRFDDARLRYLVEIDYRNRFAVAALTPGGDGMAIARYEGAFGSDFDAEVAVTVTPAYRRMGLATALFEVLEEAGRANGFRRFHANYLAENEAAEKLMAAAGYAEVSYEAGIATVSKAIAGE